MRHSVNWRFHLLRSKGSKKLSTLRKFAQGQECTIQIYPYCNGDPATTVLAHAPSEEKGWAIKSPDHWGAHSCNVCHDIVDGRHSVDLPQSEVLACLYRGVFRTQKRLIEDGLITIKGE